MSSEPMPPPPDQDQRDLITHALDQSMMVEAAAGTGKTASLVARLVELLRTGKCGSIRHLAAVTFTRKAAAELRARFQLALEQAVRETGPEEERDRLRDALRQIDLCFVGTIHAFCGRLLRERPVEAGMDPAFEELEEEGDRRLRREAWELFAAKLQSHDSLDLLPRLQALGLRPADLADEFVRFVNFPDVGEWPAPADGTSLPTFEATVQALRSYVAHMRELALRLPQDRGEDRILPLYRSLPRVVSHCGDLGQPRELAGVLERFSAAEPKIGEWTKSGDLSPSEAREEKRRWSVFRAEHVVPFLSAWRAHRYATVLRVLQSAREVYDHLRLERAEASFGDLLLRAAALLRDKPHVRTYFRERYTHLLVDEFQDTDPIQAEVMLLLTASNPEETDWRRCRPRPGSLFVVGDPKQSIYRFRRADIVTYGTVKSILSTREEDGRLVQLSANFRSGTEIVEWVNRVFSRAFPERGSTESPPYVPLQPRRGHLATQHDLAGVRALSIPEECSRAKDQVIPYEADRIARSIRFALDHGLTVPRRPREIEEGRPRTATPGDFMIVTHGRAHLSAYSHKLREYGIPHQVSGGSALNEVPELRLLHRCLRAVLEPDHPVALVAALRSELFGVSDAALYALKKAGGRFCYRGLVPEELAGEDGAALRDAWTRLTRYADWLDRLPPLAAVERMVGDLGLMALASSREGGDVEAGSLAKALEMLRTAQGDAWTVAQLAERLAELVSQQEKADGLSALSGDRDRVRVMNLHRVKGLEAPVVFLADPTGRGAHDVQVHVDRSGGGARGYLAVYSSQRTRRSATLLAHPEGWDEISARERAFLEAEELRLQYVAATRAGALLVVSQRRSGNHRNPWHVFAEALRGVGELPDPGPQDAPSRRSIDLGRDVVAAAQGAVAESLRAACRPTYQVWAARRYASAPERERPISRVLAEPADEPRAESGEHGTEWGSVIHLLLQASMRDPRADLSRLAAAALAEVNLEQGLAEEAVAAARSVMGSALWRRALRSRQHFAEVPFQLPAERLPARGEPSPALPGVVRGVIDLVFREPAGWVLVDYKTDDLRRGQLAALVERYAPQVLLYGDAWRHCTGEPVADLGLFFTQHRTYVSVRCR